MNVLIKKAGMDDLDLLIEWRMRVISEVFANDVSKDSELIRKNNEEYYKENLKNNSHTACFAICTDTGEIVGCGGICYQKEMPSPDNQTGTNGYIMNIYTMPEVRGEGIGRMIIQFLIKDAKQRGTEKIYLESSKNAKKLYREIGFTDIEDYMKLPHRETRHG